MVRVEEGIGQAADAFLPPVDVVVLRRPDLEGPPDP